MIKCEDIENRTGETGNYHTTPPKRNYYPADCSARLTKGSEISRRSYRQIWREARVNGLHCLGESANVVVGKSERKRLKSFSACEDFRTLYQIDFKEKRLKSSNACEDFNV